MEIAVLLFLRSMAMMTQSTPARPWTASGKPPAPPNSSWRWWEERRRRSRRQHLLSHFSFTRGAFILTVFLFWWQWWWWWKPHHHLLQHVLHCTSSLFFLYSCNSQSQISDLFITCHHYYSHSIGCLFFIVMFYSNQTFLNSHVFVWSSLVTVWTEQHFLSVRTALFKHCKLV